MLSTSLTKKNKYYYDEEAAERAVAFIESFIKHIKGSKAGQKFILESWQKDKIIRPIFGWKNKKTKLRKYRTCYVEIPRKNGKSSLGACLALYMLFADEEFGSECFSVAGDRNQASIIFDLAKSMVLHSKELSARAKVYRGSIVNEAKGNTYKALSADSKLQMGHNAQFVAFDELHIQPNRLLFDTMQTSQAARKQPLFFMMTTAGSSKTDGNICWEQHDYAVKIKDKIISDDSFLSVIYAADEEDDFTCPKVWEKANPNLGVSIEKEYFIQQAQKATDIIAYENNFKRLHLNIWTSSYSKWISDKCWLENYQKIDMKELEGKTAYGALDLASTRDTSCFCLLFPLEESFVVLPFFFVPGDAIYTRTMKDKVPYNQWEKEGFLDVSPGDVQDYEYIRAKVNELREIYDIKSVAFDRWNSSQIIIQLQDDGLALSPFGQGYASLSNPSKELEKLFLKKQINHLNNPILRWQLQNVQIQSDAAGNIKPNKQKSSEKIDGIIALIMSLGEFLTEDSPGASVYDDRGLLML
tara:strand:+ start:1674 stop:3254 length:1581 start_codon:yes stop_codon:yes gene_type:complete